jgi:hypothetical protein
MFRLDKHAQIWLAASLALFSWLPQPTLSATGIDDPTIVVEPSSLPLQPVDVPFIDPSFRTTLRRITDASDTGSFATHIYSQLQAFSLDDVYLLLIEADSYIVRRLDDLSLVAGLDTSSWNAPRWHPRQPHILVHFDSNEDAVIRLQFMNVDSLTTTTIFTFPAEYERIRGNQSFDELSEDGRWLAGMASVAGDDQMIFALDIETPVLGAQLSLNALYGDLCQPDPDYGIIEPDWIGVSPQADYLVIQWPRDGTERCSGMETFDLQTGDFVGRVYDGHQHGDLGVHPDGVAEYFMTFELYHPSGNLSLGVRSLPGTDMSSPPDYVQVMDWHGEHISCRGLPGICLVTTAANPSDGWGPLEGELFMQYIDGSVLRLAHHRSTSCGYWVQPRASLSRSGLYAVFTSDWGQETGENSCSDGGDLGRGDVYIIDLTV